MAQLGRALEALAVFFVLAMWLGPQPAAAHRFSSFSCATDFYAELGVAPTASKSAIRKAFIKLTRIV